MSASEWYEHGSFPTNRSFGASASMRAELEAIQAGLSDKLPDLSGNANKLIGVNAGGNALEAKSITFAGAFTTVGSYAVTLTFTGVTGVTFPTSGTLATRAGVETLTNKTLTSPVLSNPSYSGTTSNGGTVTTIDINGGTIDGTAIGGETPAAGAFTTVSATGNMSATGSISGSNLEGTNTGDNAANSQYADDYRAANFVAGTDYLSPSDVGVTVQGYAEPIRVNPRFITANFTVASAYNAASVGPITVSDGVTVTVNDNATWSIH